jgi:hypothetical protein
MSNMNSKQRSDEVDLIESVYNILGVNVLYRVTGEGHL